MIDPDTLDWAKMDGLVPAIVQHADSGEVRMLGYMDRAALEATIRDRLVTFYSRSRGRPVAQGRDQRQSARPGRSSASTATAMPCWSLARPRGPTCHTGTASCFGDDVAPFLPALAAHHRRPRRGRPGEQLHRAPACRGHQADRAEGRRGRGRDRARSGRGRPRRTGKPRRRTCSIICWYCSKRQARRSTR